LKHTKYIIKYSDIILLSVIIMNDSFGSESTNRENQAIR